MESSGTWPPLPDGAEIEIVTDRSDEALELMRHDAAHVMATAVTELWPGTKVSIGPPIADGFYYDFDFPNGVSVSEDDLAAIEEKMAGHIAADQPFERSEEPVAAALERFRAAEEPYKVELIEDWPPTRTLRSSPCAATAPSSTSVEGPTGHRPGE